jgi:DHA2 family multidrug resistance protein-like MFS transporter
MLGTARLLGQTTGAALVGLIFGLFGTDATTAALAVASGIALVAALVSSLRLFGTTVRKAATGPSLPGERPPAVSENRSGTETT